MVPTPRRHLHTAAMTATTSDLLRDIESFDDFEYSVEAAAKNREKMRVVERGMKVFDDYVAAEHKRDELVAKLSVIDWIEANVAPELQPYQRSATDAMTVTVNVKSSPEPTEAEMIEMVEKLRASSVGRKWLAAQKLARAMSFDPIGDHVREHRPRGRHIQIDDAGDPDGGWWGKGDQS